jgi:uncharacterized surface protein with fasciclin (FAS1) repeats
MNFSRSDSSVAICLLLAPSIIFNGAIVNCTQQILHTSHEATISQFIVGLNAEESSQQMVRIYVALLLFGLFGPRGVLLRASPQASQGIDSGLTEDELEFQVEIIDNKRDDGGRNKNQEEAEDRQDDEGGMEFDDDDEEEDGEVEEDEKEEEKRRGGPDLMRVLERQRGLSTFLDSLKKVKLDNRLALKDDDDSKSPQTKEGKKTPLTVFAPTDRAFQKVSIVVFQNEKDSVRDITFQIPFRERQLLLNDGEALLSLLNRHISTKEAFTDDLPQTASVLFPTFGGEYVTVTTNGRSKVSVTSSVAEAKVTESDISAANGVIHIIDTVL